MTIDSTEPLSNIPRDPARASDVKAGPNDEKA